MKYHYAEQAAIAAKKQAERENAAPLLDHIKTHHSGNQAAFAAAQGVKPQQVTQWINKGFIVVNGELYSPRRTLSK